MGDRTVQVSMNTRTAFVCGVILFMVGCTLCLTVLMYRDQVRDGEVRAEAEARARAFVATPDRIPHPVFKKRGL